MKSTNEILSGKTAFITAGVSGIGLGIAEKFIKSGANVMLIDLNKTKLLEEKERLGDKCKIAIADVTSESDVEQAVKETVSAFGRIDIGVNAAGIGTFASIVDLDINELTKVLDVSFKGVFISMKMEARQMISQGTPGVLINISSLNGTQPAEGMSAYCSAKAGVNMLTKVAAMELGSHGIRVNGIAPGLVNTPATAGVFEIKPIYDTYLDNTPLKTPGYSVKNIAGAALFLASEDAAWVTGVTIPVDGGAHTKRYPEMIKIQKEMGLA